jgi:hypothetical protein
LAFESYGVRVGIRTNKPEILEGLERVFPFGWKPCAKEGVDHLYSIRVGRADRPNVRFFHLLYADATRVLRTFDLRHIFQLLEVDLEIYVAEQARRRIFVHAGVVGWNGEAILLPGQSGSGKTTLVAALVRAGATYYSDEYAVVDAKGRVHPYPRPLSIRSETAGQPAVTTPVEALGGRAGREPLPVGTVVVTRYQEGTSWRPRRISAGETALKLLAHTVSVRYAPQQALTGVLRIANRARNLTGVRGDAGDLVAALLDGSRTESR